MNNYQSHWLITELKSRIIIIAKTHTYLGPFWSYNSDNNSNIYLYVSVLSRSNDQNLQYRPVISCEQVSDQSSCSGQLFGCYRSIKLISCQHYDNKQCKHRLYTACKHILANQISSSRQLVASGIQKVNRVQEICLYVCTRARTHTRTDAFE